MPIDVVRVRYARLFEVRLLHHYWLDEGATVFDAIADQATRTRRLLAYDVHRLLTIRPSLATEAAIAGLRGILRPTGIGFLIAVPDGTTVPTDATWEFFVTVTDPDYLHYTALSLRPQPVADVVDPTDSRIVRRYKANVPVLSNLTGASQGTGPDKRLFLSRPYITGAGAGDGAEALVIAGTSLRQLTGDPPNAPFQVLGSRADHPVYVHQGDVPEIVPPGGTSGAPPAGIELTADTPPAVTAVIRLATRRSNDGAFSVTGADGMPRVPSPIFEIHLRNRWTTRRYRNRSDGAVSLTEADPLPLTYFGNVGTRQPPAPAALDIERDPTDPARITRLISDIYV